MRNRKEGFTLIELLIVIAIIGILAAVLIPNLLDARKRAFDTAAQSCAKSLQTAQEVYLVDNLKYENPDITNDSFKEGTDKYPLNDACYDDNITVADAAVEKGNRWTATVTHGNGQKIFTVTNNSLNGVDK